MPTSQAPQTLMWSNSAQEVHINILNQHTKNILQQSSYSEDTLCETNNHAIWSGKNLFSQNPQKILTTGPYMNFYFILAYIFLNLQNIHSITQLVFQILLSNLFKTQGLCLGVTVKPPKMNLSICCFYGCLRILLQVKESCILIGL